MLNAAQQWEPLEDFDPRQNPTPGELDPEHEAYFETWINIQRQHAVGSDEGALAGADIASADSDGSPGNGSVVNGPDPSLNIQREHPMLVVKRHFDQILNGQQKDEPDDSREHRKAMSLVRSLRRLEAAIERCYAIEDAQGPDPTIKNGKFFLLVWTVDELLLFKDEDGRCVPSDFCHFTHATYPSGFVRKCTQCTHTFCMCLLTVLYCL